MPVSHLAEAEAQRTEKFTYAQGQRGLETKSSHVINPSLEQLKPVSTVNLTPTLLSFTDKLVITAGDNMEALATALQEALALCLQGISSTPVPQQRIQMAKKIMAFAQVGLILPLTPVKPNLKNL